MTLFRELSVSGDGSCPGSTGHRPEAAGRIIRFIEWDILHQEITKQELGTNENNSAVFTTILNFVRN